MSDTLSFRYFQFSGLSHELIDNPSRKGETQCYSCQRAGCSDPIVEMAMTAFTSLMLLATQIDSKNEEEQKAAISEAMDRREIDLTSLLPGMKSCDLVIGENGRAVLQADNGSVQVSRELTSAELSRLSVTLNDGSLSEEAKRLRVTGLLNTVILSEAASLNFEQGMAEQRGQTEILKR